MGYILIALFMLFLPGLVITYLLNLDRYRYLLSFSISYSLFVFLLKSMPFFGFDAEAFKYIYFLSMFSIILLGILKYKRSKLIKGGGYAVKCHGCESYSKWPPVLIIIFVFVYFLMAGAYVELPSDVFQHLEYMQNMTRNILYSQETADPVVRYLGQNGKYWHYLYSLIAIWTGASLHESILPASIINVSIFLLGVFYFSLIVFKEMQPSPKLLMYTSLAAVFLTFLHFGVNVFSFVRYYALAPVILSFVLYFSVMAIVIDFYRENKWNFKYLLVAGIVFYSSLLIHRQEALFAILMVCIMSFYLFALKHIPNLKLLWQGQAKSIRIAPIKFLTDKVNISFLLTQIVMVSLFIYSYLSIPRHPINQPKVIPLENIFPFFKNLYILNPTYQFYYVVTLWGTAVIILFVLNIKKFTHNPYLMAGMLSPFFTIFNPFFTDLFLRHSWSLMMWRMSFLVPLHLVAAYLFICAIQYIWIGSYLKKAYGTVSIVILIALLFPFKSIFLENTYSRLLTLKPVPVENSPDHWGDLIDYLNTVDDKKRIITDPVTGYMLTALTDHVSARKKFHRRWGGFIKFNYDDYSSNPFDRYKGYLFIVNKRNGGMSETGRVARHWPEGILQIENYYYSEKMEDYISSNPDRFRLLWEKDRIRVYSIGLISKKMRAK